MTLTGGTASMRSLEIAMYAPGLVAEGRHFGSADLVQQRGTVAELAQICQAWGAAIATLHATATHRSSAPIAARPWVIKPEHRTASMRSVLPGPGHTAVLRAYESSSELRAATREVDERWTELHWIHGNFTATNVFIQHRPALLVSFADLDGAGLGDPAWDLASAVDMIAWLAQRWRALPQPLVEYLLLGYRRAGGPGRLYPAIQAVRALATAKWVAESPLGPTPEQHLESEVAFWLDRARAHAARLGCLMAVA
jgi:Ser/Thr protein kinase RdoA (MazF antagonist)